MSAEPIQPSADIQDAEHHMHTAAKHLRAAYTLLHAVDPELERRIAEIHTTACQVLHGMRG